MPENISPEQIAQLPTNVLMAILRHEEQQQFHQPQHDIFQYPTTHSPFQHNQAAWQEFTLPQSGASATFDRDHLVIRVPVKKENADLDNNINAHLTHLHFDQKVQNTGQFGSFDHGLNVFDLDPFHHDRFTFPTTTPFPTRIEPTPPLREQIVQPQQDQKIDSQLQQIAASSSAISDVFYKAFMEHFQANLHPDHPNIGQTVSDSNNQNVNPPSVVETKSQLVEPTIAVPPPPPIRQGGIETNTLAQKKTPPRKPNNPGGVLVSPEIPQNQDTKVVDKSAKSKTVESVSTRKIIPSTSNPLTVSSTKSKMKPVPKEETTKEKKPKTMREVLAILRKRLKDQGIPKEKITVSMLKKMIRKDKKLLAMIRQSKRFRKKKPNPNANSQTADVKPGTKSNKPTHGKDPKPAIQNASSKLKPTDKKATQASVSIAPSDKTSKTEIVVKEVMKDKKINTLAKDTQENVIKSDSQAAGNVDNTVINIPPPPPIQATTNSNKSPKTHSLIDNHNHLHQESNRKVNSKPSKIIMKEEAESVIISDVTSSSKADHIQPEINVPSSHNAKESIKSKQTMSGKRESENVKRLDGVAVKGGSGNEDVIDLPPPPPPPPAIIFGKTPVSDNKTHLHLSNSIKVRNEHGQSSVAEINDFSSTIKRSQDVQSAITENIRKDNVIKAEHLSEARKLNSRVSNISQSITLNQTHTFYENTELSSTLHDGNTTDVIFDKQPFKSANVENASISSNASNTAPANDTTYVISDEYQLNKRTVENAHSYQNASNTSSVDPKSLPPFPFLFLLKPTLFKKILNLNQGKNSKITNKVKMLKIMNFSSNPIVLNNETGVVHSFNDSISGVKTIRTKIGRHGSPSLHHEISSKPSPNTFKPSVSWRRGQPLKRQSAPPPKIQPIDSGGIPIPAHLVSDITQVLERIEKKTSKTSTGAVGGSNVQISNRGQMLPPSQSQSLIRDQTIPDVQTLIRDQTMPSSDIQTLIGDQAMSRTDVAASIQHQTPQEAVRGELSKRIRDAQMRGRVNVNKGLGVMTDPSEPIIDVKSPIPNTKITSGLNTRTKQSLGVKQAVEAVKKLDNQIANLLKTMKEGRRVATPKKTKEKSTIPTIQKVDNPKTEQSPKVDLSHLGIGRPEHKPRLVENKPTRPPGIVQVQHTANRQQQQSSAVSSPQSDLAKLASRLSQSMSSGSPSSTSGASVSSSVAAPSNLDINGLISMVKFALNQPSNSVASSPLMSQIQTLISSQTSPSGQTVESPLMTQIKQAITTLTSGSSNQGQGQFQQMNANDLLNQFLSKVSPTNGMSMMGQGGAGNSLSNLLSQFTSSNSGGMMGGMPTMVGGSMPMNIGSSIGMLGGSDMPFNMGGAAGGGAMGMLQREFQNEGGGDAAELAGAMGMGGGALGGLTGMGMSGGGMFGMTGGMPGGMMFMS